MNLISLFPENQNLLAEKDILSVYQEKKNDKKEIRQDMSPEAIAETISDYLIEVIRKDFKKESAKKK